jgi:hypothetical protein
MKRDETEKNWKEYGKNSGHKVKHSNTSPQLRGNAAELVTDSAKMRNKNVHSTLYVHMCSNCFGDWRRLTRSVYGVWRSRLFARPIAMLNQLAAVESIPIKEKAPGLAVIIKHSVQ